MLVHACWEWGYFMLHLTFNSKLNNFCYFCCFLACFFFIHHWIVYGFIGRSFEFVRFFSFVGISVWLWCLSMTMIPNCLCVAYLILYIYNCKFMLILWNIGTNCNFYFIFKFLNLRGLLINLIIVSIIVANP